MIKIDHKILLRNFFVKTRLLNAAANLYRYTHFLLEGNPFKEMRHNGKAPLPKTLIYEPTMHCNLNCSMCYLKTREIAGLGEMSLDQIRRMVDHLPSSIEHCSITGGEPLMRDDSKDILTFLKNNGFFSVTLMTNGTMPERLKELLENDLISAVQLSLDGPEDIHNSIRNSTKSFALFMESLNLLRQYRRIYIYILTVICKDNLYKLAEITQFCKDMNITNLTFEYEKRYDRNCLDESIANLKPYFNLTRDDFLVTEKDSAFPEYSLSEFRQALIKLDKKAKEIGFHNQYLPYSLFKNIDYYYLRKLRSRFKLQCRHLLTLRIDPQGNVIPCFGVRKPFGNLVKNSFEEIWNSKEFCLYRKILLQNNLLPICETCHRAESFDLGFGRIN